MSLQVIILAVKAISIGSCESYYTEVVTFYTEPDTLGRVMHSGLLLAARLVGLRWVLLLWLILVNSHLVDISL